MPLASSILLVISLALAVVLGPQTRPWTWGPAMLALAAATALALPACWKRGHSRGEAWLLGLGLLTAAWFGLRAWHSPVPELARADLLLLGCATAAFITVRGIAGHPAAERTLAWGIALLLAANLAVIATQIQNPSFTPVFQARASAKAITGFFAHYNEAANFLIASSMMVAAAAFAGNHAPVTRILWTLTAVAGLAGVWLTGSRGGILGTAVAATALAALILVIAKRRESRWFAPGLITLPLVAAAAAAYLVFGWTDAQERRQVHDGIASLFDNSTRLYFLGIAMSCIAGHPLIGGGARSFSWECLPLVHGRDHGDSATHRPDMVHNELVQAATDYGLTGAALLIALLGFLTIGAVIRLALEPGPGPRNDADAWRLGGLAALVGMLVQSCFSFVFHLLPGVLLLGVCLGWISRRSPPDGTSPSRLGPVATTATAIPLLILLASAGWTGSRVTHLLWPIHFAKQAERSIEIRLDTLAEAANLWPHSAFHQEQAEWLHRTAGKTPGFPVEDSLQRALEAYASATTLHPYEPSFDLNRARILSHLKQDTPAETAFARAIRLQGGMEPAFRARFSLANHLLAKARRTDPAIPPDDVIPTLEQAAAEMESAAAMMHWVTRDMIAPRVEVHEQLGRARESTGDLTGALEAYNQASVLEGGSHVHYRAAYATARMALTDWTELRLPEALDGFNKARQRLNRAGSTLPHDVSPALATEFTAYLDRTIALLQQAGVDPRD